MKFSQLMTIGTLLVCISSQALAFDVTQWEVVSGTNLKSMWRSKFIKDAFLNSYEEKKEFDLNHFKPNDYVRELPEARSFLHGLMRIKDYKISEYSSRKLNQSWQVKIKGTYLRKGKTPVSFCEFHHFEKDSFKQRQLSSPTISWKELLGQANDCFATMGDIK